MTDLRTLLERERRSGETNRKWATLMQRKFERTLEEFQELVRQMKFEEKSYREKLSDATRRGLAAAKRRGVKLGGARVRKSKVDMSQLRRLRKLRFTQQEIAEKLGCSQALVSQLLRRLEKSLVKRKGRR